MYKLIVGATGQMKRHFIPELSDVLFFVHRLSIENCYHWVQVRQLRHSFGTISRVFLSSIIPHHARRVTHPAYLVHGWMLIAD